MKRGDHVSTIVAGLPRVLELERRAQATLGDRFRDRVGGRSPSISFAPRTNEQQTGLETAEMPHDHSRERDGPGSRKNT